MGYLMHFILYRRLWRGAKWGRYIQLGLYVLLICLVPCLSSQAQAASEIQPEVQIVRGRGAMLRGNQSKAREQAIASSLRQALEQTVADMLEPAASVSHLQVLKEQIYQQASQYVRSYRVLWEYPDLQQQVYRVELEVEVAVKAVAQDLERLGLSRVERGAWGQRPRPF